MLLLGIVIFCARVIDVSMSTVRTISIVHGWTKTAFLLGLIEVSVWLIVLTEVIDKIRQEPLLGVFYALGFSAGNVVGIRLERRLALGQVILRIVSVQGNVIAEKLREAGFAVTIFQGEGKSGPMVMVYTVCERKDVEKALVIVKDIEPDAFYTTVSAGQVSKIYRPEVEHSNLWNRMKRK